MTDEKKQICLTFFRELKAKGKLVSGFDESLTILQDVATAEGMETNDINLLTEIIIKIDFGAFKKIALTQCLIPKHRISDSTVKSMLTWCLSSLNELPITVSTIVIQWIVGLWEFQLVDRKVINMYYDVLFYAMLKKERLERHIARLIYVLTKPEDVTRRNVSRVLALQQKYKKPQKHITALLSLFKSYKPELVPEKIQSMNIESIWKPIPEVLRLRFENAKERAEILQSGQKPKQYFDWNTIKVSKEHKMQKPLLPSVGYFHIGSSIFKQKHAKSIFDVSGIEELGKYHLSVELPCNAISLLANMAGYHLLTYADFHYQSKFSYNLYNTLIRAFILENEQFSEEEMDRLLDMTVEFSRYMQQGILIVNLFFDEYLYFNTGEYQLKLLALLQWMISVSITELQEKVLVHIQNIFYESTLPMKCEIIKTFRILITNLFVNQGFDECCQNTPAPFLGQGPIDNLEDVMPILTNISRNLIVAGLNIHSYNVLLLSEALSFYEEVCTLESHSNKLSWTLAPPCVIYGAFITKSCAILSRVCRLLLRYREMCALLTERKVHRLFRNKIEIVDIYAQDLITALWFNEPFSKQSTSHFLKNLSNTVADLHECDFDSLLNICNHYATLPYKCTLSKTGLNIGTKETAINVALHYYPAVNEFIAVYNV
ncbi:hypothetical protein KM043_015480 [Ampulex compressa]|nr:hypothetical protein KM043_015480 [Ampulex compressa]